jgi:tripeptide aminopeptidase
VELIITTCEEIGLIGAKALDPKLIQAREGYALDSSGFARVITHAPAANRLTITVRRSCRPRRPASGMGRERPDPGRPGPGQGPNGRIDEETTANFGTISGGTASNIVPERVVIEGEVRSHSMEKLEQVTGEIEEIFTSTVAAWNDPTGSGQGRPR